MAKFVHVALLTCALAFSGSLAAQDTPPAPQSEAKPDAQQPPDTATPAPAQLDAVPAAAEPTPPGTVVNGVLELPPAPMLDGEGKQRVDPDGKLMFYAPVRQQRDKKGHPLVDEHGKPVMQTEKELGYDEHGKKLHPEKEKKIKTTPLTIERGVLTIDGMAGKAALNYDIADLKYIYFYAPGIGITVVSNSPFPGAKEQPKAFEDRTLTVTADGHTLQLASEKRLLSKKPEPAYVLVDRQFMLPSKFPVLGYGGTLKPPYAWPGAKPNAKLAGTVVPPPVPVTMLPTQLLAPCPAGQMRKASKPTLPGEKPFVMPCEPIMAKNVSK